MTANKPMTSEQLSDLMTVAISMQRDSEKAGDRPAAMFAYAVQVAVLELRKVRADVLALAGMEAGAVAWLWSNRKHPSEVTLIRPEDDERAEAAQWSGWSCQALYSAPQSATVVLKDHQVRDLVNELRDIAVKYHAAGQLREHISRSLRAAMLQGKAEPVSNRDELPGWVACSERMPHIGVPVITCCGDVVQYAVYAWDGKEWQDWYEEYDKLPANTFTHWHSRPAAPQQEAE